MTYCLSLLCEEGIVFLSDSRSNAGMDNINVHRKMYVYEVPGERVVCLMTSGNLSLTHTVIALIEEDMLAAKMSPDHPHLMNQRTMFETARYVGTKIREVEATERPHLEKDDYRFNINCIVGGQIAALPHQIYRIYPQGNVVHASDDSPFLQIGEFKYGKPILDRGFTYKTSLCEAVKFGALSMDSTMKSNVSVGPPVDILCYTKDSLKVCHRVRLSEGDPYLQESRGRWSRGLTELVRSMPELKFPDEPQDLNIALTSG
jgi:putative proteasome-type protease